MRNRWILVATVALVLLALLRTQFLLVLPVGESMLPTVRSGEVLVVFRSAYRTLPPHRGDVVLVRHANESFIKRVVGRPGDEIELRAGVLCLNDTPCFEPYCAIPGRNPELSIAKARLAADRFAVLGDNRTLPPELFVYAVVPKDQILGKVMLSLPIRLGGTTFFSFR
ncbi:MAG: signal peptidase I [Verrucomicrobiia bacterium]